MTALRVVQAGPACTLQDAGRVGHLRYGVTPAGAMDWIARREASILAGNDPDAAAIEIGPGGIVVAAEGGAVRVGLSAEGFTARSGDAAVPPRSAFVLAEGAELTVRPGLSHVWGYLAVGGAFAISPVLGSLSTHLRSGIGPLGGRALASGDLLPIGSFDDSAAAPLLTLPPCDGLGPGGIIRFVPGPQDDHFTDAARAAFTGSDYFLSRRSDRMGYRLDGPPIAHRAGHDIVSDGIAMGAIQVPGDGLPIVLMADRQPTGGYPKIGTVIRADLPRLAQMRSGQALRFRAVTVDEAVAALRTATVSPGALRAALRPVAAGPDLSRLASGDHASGFIDARTADPSAPR